jgi:hypothetical protein
MDNVGIITENDILRFQDLYLARFGVNIDEEIARGKLLMLVNQMVTIYRPISKKQLSKYENENEHNEQDGPAKNS